MRLHNRGATSVGNPSFPSRRARVTFTLPPVGTAKQAFPCTLKGASACVACLPGQAQHAPCNRAATRHAPSCRYCALPRSVDEPSAGSKQYGSHGAGLLPRTRHAQA
ncbi:hypothetical protein HPB50_021917 [Hyalomma asiaticum]|uniref:Uncharacterized protein n=1 Tax=Hyalomma asiaticum TaxID=266040 RepID=A0ACB7SY38_HYAAI|nr:hypothetical protein HPB50_021917 [Hyalomma asiaticum]